MRISFVASLLLLLACKSERPRSDAMPSNQDAGDAADAEFADGGELADGGFEDGGLEDATEDAGSCIPETDRELCVALNAECGPASTVDRCSAVRNLACGGCNVPETCGARGAVNQCAVEHWDVITADDSGDVGREVSMVLGPDGYPRVAYQEDTGVNTILRFAAYDGASWTVETIDNGVLAGMHTAIAYDPNGVLHIAATSFDGLVIWRESNTGWVREDLGGIARGRLDLAFDADGRAHICAYVESVENLDYFRQELGGGWMSESIEGGVGTEERQGDYCSIAVSPDGVVHVSYEDNQFGRLKYARNEGSGWLREVVDNPANDTAGTYTSIAVDSSGAPVISYRYGLVGSREIRLARRGGGGWTIDTVDPSAGTIANFTSLAIDGAGIAHVSYFDATAGFMRYAKENGGSWDRDIIEAVGTGTGGHNAIAVDTSSIAHVVFYNSSSGSLRYARYVP